MNIIYGNTRKKIVHISLIFSEKRAKVIKNSKFKERSILCSKHVNLNLKFNFVYSISFIYFSIRDAVLIKTCQSDFLYCKHLQRIFVEILGITFVHLFHMNV